MSLLGGPAWAPPPVAPPAAGARPKPRPRKGQGEKYRLRYVRLRRAAKALVFENAALCDEIARLEDKCLRAKEERRYLLAQLLQRQARAEGDGQGPPAPPRSSALPPAYGLAGAAGTLPGPGPGAGAEELFGKRSRKEKNEKGQERSTLEAAAGRAWPLPWWLED